MGGNEEFQARLARIQAGRGANQLGTVHRGPAPSSFAQETPAETPAWSLPLALLLGGIAVFGGKVAAYHLLRNSTAVDPTTATVIAVGDGLILAYVLGQVLGFSRLSHRIATGLGMLATAALFHNFAHWAPGPMADAFSAEWVLAAQGAAPVNTIWLGGDFVELAPAAEPEPQASPCPPPKAEVTILQTDHAKAPKSGHKTIAAPQPEAPCP